MRVAGASQAIVQAIEVYRPLLPGMSRAFQAASLFVRRTTPTIIRVELTRNCPSLQLMR
jgi:hypothetical protein